MFEFLFQLLIEIVGQIIFEGLTTLGWESLKHSGRRERRANPVLAAMGHFLMGLCAGVLSLFIMGRRLTPHSPLPGISLVLSPIGTGIAMHWIGAGANAAATGRPCFRFAPARYSHSPWRWCGSCISSWSGDRSRPRGVT